MSHATLRSGLSGLGKPQACGHGQSKYCRQWHSCIALFGLLITGCASPVDDDLWYCQEQGAYLYCVPERSIDALSGTRNAGIAPTGAGVTL